MGDQRERPILFSGPMVRAILAGKKTQTRRPMAPQPEPFAGGVNPRNPNGRRHPAPYIDSYCNRRPTPLNPRGMSDNWCWWTEDDRQGDGWYRCPFGAPGDRLWLRETWCQRSEGGDLVYTPGGDLDASCCWYAADGDAVEALDDNGGLRLRKDGSGASPWRPSIHMPRWASRLTVEVTGLRVERLQAISDEDLEAEGYRTLFGGGHFHRAFESLWDGIYGGQLREDDRFTTARSPRRPGCTWRDNPWVWVVEFRTV